MELTEFLYNHFRLICQYYYWTLKELIFLSKSFFQQLYVEELIMCFGGLNSFKIKVLVGKSQVSY